MVNRCVDDYYLNYIIEERCYHDALEYLNAYYSESAPDYLFYLAYLQGVLGWTDEAMQTLQNYKSDIKGTVLESSVSGFLADIYSNENWYCEAFEEITHALELEPESELIQEKYHEIRDKWTFNYSFYWFLICVDREVKNGKR